VFPEAFLLYLMSDRFKNTHGLMSRELMRRSHCLLMHQQTMAAALLRLALVSLATGFAASTAAGDVAFVTQAQASSNFVHGPAAERRAQPFRFTSFQVTGVVRNRLAATNVTMTGDVQASMREAVIMLTIPEDAFISSLFIFTGDIVHRATVSAAKAAREEYERAKQQGQTAAMAASTKSKAGKTITLVVSVGAGEEATISIGYEEWLTSRRGQYEYNLALKPGPGGPLEPGLVPKVLVDVEITDIDGLQSVSVQKPAMSCAFQTTSAVDLTCGMRGPNARRDAAQIRFLTSNRASVILRPTLDDQQDAEWGGVKAGGMALDLIISIVPNSIVPGAAGIVMFDNEGFFAHVYRNPALSVMPKTVVLVLDTSGSMLTQPCTGTGATPPPPPGGAGSPGGPAVGNCGRPGQPPCGASAPPTPGGSWCDSRMEQAKKAANSILDKLQAADEFAILGFDEHVNSFFVPNIHDSARQDVHVPPLLNSASKENVEQAKQFVNKLQAGGGTNIYEALAIGLALASPASYDPRALMSTPYLINFPPASSIPKECKNLGYPGSPKGTDKPLDAAGCCRLYSQMDCETGMGGISIPTGECLKSGGGSWSYDCRGLNADGGKHTGLAPPPSLALSRYCPHLYQPPPLAQAVSKSNKGSDTQKLPDRAPDLTWVRILQWVAFVSGLSMIGIATTSSLICCGQRPGQQVERAVELGVINSVSNNNNTWVHTAGANLGNEAEEADEGGAALASLPRTPQTQTPPGQAVEERGSYYTGEGERGVAATSRPGDERPETQPPGAPLAQAPAQEAQQVQQPARAATPHAALAETAAGAGDSVGTSAGNGCTSPPVLQHNGTPSAPDLQHNATAPELEHRGFMSGAVYDAEARAPPATLGYAHVVPQAVPVASIYVPPGSHLERGIQVSQTMHAFPEQVQVSQVGVAPFFYKVALVQLVLGFFAFFLGLSQIYFPGALVSSVVAIAAACITLKWCVCCNTTTETAHVSCSRTMNGVTVVSSVCGFTSALIFFFIWMYVARLNERGEDGGLSWSGPQQSNSLCKELQQQLNSSKPGRARMVLLLTDGYPTHGEYQVALTLPFTRPWHFTSAATLPLPCRYPAATLPHQCARLCQTVNVRAAVREGGRTHSRSLARAAR
jgi:hypothetical protein